MHAMAADPTVHPSSTRPGGSPILQKNKIKIK